MPSQASKAHRMSYRIGRGETGVLTFEPYKSEILPLWRFKTPSIALQSRDAIYAKFLAYGAANDFIGMDMARKFLQMGMTRAKRYANHAGGRKYDKSTGEELQKSMAHKGREEKMEASLIFREGWEWARKDEGYKRLKEGFVREQKEWDREVESREKDDTVGDEGKRVKEEEEVVGNEAKGSRKGGRARVKKEIKEEKD